MRVCRCEGPILTLRPSYYPLTSQRHVLPRLGPAALAAGMHFPGAGILHSIQRDAGGVGRAILDRGDRAGVHGRATAWDRHAGGRGNHRAYGMHTGSELLAAHTHRPADPDPAPRAAR